MNDIERGKDAADKTSQAKRESGKPSPDNTTTKKQDEPNYDKRTDDGQAVDPTDLSSANDE